MTGSIYQRADGRWVSAMTIDGRRVLKYAPTEAAAIIRLSEMGGDIEARRTRQRDLDDAIEDALMSVSCDCGEVHGGAVRNALMARGLRLVGKPVAVEWDADCSADPSHQGHAHDGD